MGFPESHWPDWRSGIRVANREAVEELAIDDGVSRRILCQWAMLTEDVEPFIVAGLQHKSSQGAPVPLESAIGTLWKREGQRMGVLGELTDHRDDRGFRSAFLAFRKTV